MEQQFSDYCINDELALAQEPTNKDKYELVDCIIVGTDENKDANKNEDKDDEDDEDDEDYYENNKDDDENYENEDEEAYYTEIITAGIEEEINFDKKYLFNSIKESVYKIAEIRYKNMYDKHILKEYNKNIAIFCAMTSRKSHIIKFTSHYDKLIRLTEFYNYITNNVKVLLEQTNVKHIKKSIKMLIEETEIINYIRNMINNRINNCKCYVEDNKSNRTLYLAKLHLELSFPYINTCIYCRGLNLKFYRLNLEKALDSAFVEHNRVLKELNKLLK